MSGRSDSTATGGRHLIICKTKKMMDKLAEKVDKIVFRPRVDVVALLAVLGESLANDLLLELILDLLLFKLFLCL